MNNVLLTVVITVYNEEKYISECIESVINQSYKNLDIIIVDDGSKDGSLLKCREYEKRDSRITVIAKENGGSVSARKAGISNAKGTYITYIDGDDWLETDHYEKIMSQIDGADIFAFSLTCIYDNDVKEIISNESENGVYEGDKLTKLKKKALFSGDIGKFGLFPSMCAKVFKTELIKENLYAVKNDIRMGDDGACTFPSICDSNKIIVNNDIAGYLYRKNIQGTITSSYNYVEFSRIESLYEVLSKAFSDRNADYMMTQMTYYLAFLFRAEMVKELSYLRLTNLTTKLTHLNEIKKLNWIKYVEKTAELEMLDKETSILLSTVNKPLKLMFDWYIKRRICK